jgi:endonuclease/exonuclease/phosphatase family metal-dependent hydrolase
LPFTTLTCNVLADGYIRREWYPHTPDEWLDPARRHPALAAHLAAMAADILCLQEVEAPMFATLKEHLAHDGYTGELVSKGLGKPDGCAIFWRGGVFEAVRRQHLEYSDGTAARAASGHIAQLMVFRHGERLLGIANSHLKFDLPEAPPERRYAPAQIAELLAACAATEPAPAGWIICGDFNLTPDSPVVATLRAAGYEFAHHAKPAAYTAAPRRRPKVIDYLFHSQGLIATPIPPPAIDGTTPLPGPGQPSDHLALAARFDWA